MNIPISVLESVVERFRGTRVLVVGDVILDRFVWGRVERISPEAPVPVVEIDRESQHLGGAANVACNLAVLGAEPILVGVVGDDEAAGQLRSELARRGISQDRLIADPQRRTTAKTRIIAGHQQVCRADLEHRHPISDAALERILESSREGMEEAQAVILSDYAKGVLHAESITTLIAQARQLDRFLAVDPKTGDFSVYQGASVITPNKKEAEVASGIPIQDSQSLTRAGRRLIDQAGLGFLLLTRGEEGMTLFDGEGENHIPTVAREVFDVTGAGDTVISVFGLAMACGALPLQAAVLANHAAGVVVGKLGTAQARPEELFDSLRGGRH